MSKKTGKRIIAILSIASLLSLGTGCVSESPTAPEEHGQAPTLPPAEKLDFDFSFFGDSPEKTLDEATKLNFLNAVVRVAAISVISRLVITPPVAAFALALHTIPSPQPDGSWIWVYTFVSGAEEAQIRLRGKHEGDHTDWALRITALHENPPVENELWFDGQTWEQGETGSWTFYDFTREGAPAVATLEWDNDEYSEELVFTDLDENPGNELAYRSSGSDCAITLYDDAEGETWFIQWNEEDGTGSLRVPDYNGGEEACWDENKDDIDCTPAL